MLAAEIRAFRAAGAVILLVDLIGNGGGSEWAEAAVAASLTTDVCGRKYFRITQFLVASRS